MQRYVFFVNYNDKIGQLVLTTIISPAKKLDYETVDQELVSSEPTLLDHSKILIADLRKLSPQKVSSLMGLSDKLGALNYERFQEWQLPFTKNNAKQAIMAFKGDVYQGLDAASLSNDDLAWAQENLRILSGLYGILKPLDLMQAYRLEMGTKLKTERGKDLYEFWGSSITDELNHTFKSSDSILLNLASNEYFRSINQAKINARIITPVFMDYKNDKYKIISFFAKKARGLMTRFVIKNRITDANQIKDFSEAGYKFNKAMSTEEKPVFCRN